MLAYSLAEHTPVNNVNENSQKSITGRTKRPREPRGPRVFTLRPLITIAAHSRNLAVIFGGTLLSTFHNAYDR